MLAAFFIVSPRRGARRHCLARGPEPWLRASPAGGDIAAVLVQGLLTPAIHSDKSLSRAAKRQHHAGMDAGAGPRSSAIVAEARLAR